MRPVLVVCATALLIAPGWDWLAAVFLVVTVLHYIAETV